MKKLGFILIILFNTNSHCFSQEFSKEHLKLDSISIWNIQNEKISLDSINPKVIVFLNNYSCSSCISQLCEVINSDKNLLKKTILISRPGFMPVIKRDYSSKVVDICSCIRESNLYYDIELIEEDDYRFAEIGLFNLLNISKTPSLAIFINKKWRIYKYEDLFSKKDGDLKSEIIQILQK